MKTIGDLMKRARLVRFHLRTARKNTLYAVQVLLGNGPKIDTVVTPPEGPQHPIELCKCACGQDAPPTQHDAGCLWLAQMCRTCQGNGWCPKCGGDGTAPAPQAPECPEKGRCHGSLSWCDICGNVSLQCDMAECDVHRIRRSLRAMPAQPAARGEDTVIPIDVHNLIRELRAQIAKLTDERDDANKVAYIIREEAQRYKARLADAVNLAGIKAGRDAELIELLEQAGMGAPGTQNSRRQSPSMSSMPGIYSSLPPSPGSGTCSQRRQARTPASPAAHSPHPRSLAT